MGKVQNCMFCFSYNRPALILKAGETFFIELNLIFSLILVLLMFKSEETMIG